MLGNTQLKNRSVSFNGRSARLGHLAHKESAANKANRVSFYDARSCVLSRNPAKQARLGHRVRKETQGRTERPESEARKGRKEKKEPEELKVTKVIQFVARKVQEARKGRRVILGHQAQ